LPSTHGRRRLRAGVVRTRPGPAGWVERPRLASVPELPEVQALAERVAERLVGACLVRAVPLAFSGLKTVSPSPEALAGSRLRAVGRRGKFLVLELDRDSLRVLVHLSQGGRLDFETKSVNSRPRGAVVRFVFERLPQVLIKEFGTERKAGWWILADGEEGPLAKLGPEPFSDAFAELVRTGTDGSRLHSMLRDQRVVAGIGRGYSDDILHRAMLSPYRSLGSLSGEERERFLTAIHQTLTEALEVERRRPAGLPPKLGDHFTVHGRSGTPCPRCGGDLRRVSYESHEVTYCPTCQTGGKVLADRRLSRLLR
jgi:formamidopyrimidine-DNA glycosylase